MAQRENGKSNAKKKHATPKSKTRSIVISLIVLFALVAVVLWGVLWLKHKISLIRNNPEEMPTDEVYATRPIEDIKLNTEEKEEYIGQIEQNQEEKKSLIENDKNVTHILLMATDAREETTWQRSDTMILLSINKQTKKIVLCSILRDTLVKIPDGADAPTAGQLDKLNHAHAYGGPDLTMACLRENFGINVEHYVKVRFTSFVDVVDTIGGVSMYLTADEVRWINNGVKGGELKRLFPNYNDALLDEVSGVHRLNGIQALYHARNRAIGDDFARTERQRNIIMQILKEMKGKSLFELDGILEAVLPKVISNMSDELLTDLTLNALNYVGYEQVSTRFPLDGAFTEGKEGVEFYCIIPDIEANFIDLYEKIYGYKPELKKEEAKQ